MKQAVVFLRDRKAGVLTEDENGYTFQYDRDFLLSDDAEAISLTLPLSEKPFHDKVLFPFFDGLIPEGWLLDIAEKRWKGAYIAIRNWRKVKRISTRLAQKRCLGLLSSRSCPIHEKTCLNLQSR